MSAQLNYNIFKIAMMPWSPMLYFFHGAPNSWRHLCLGKFYLVLVYFSNILLKLSILINPPPCWGSVSSLTCSHPSFVSFVFSPIVKASSCSSNILTLSTCHSEGCTNKIAHSWHKSFFTAAHIVCMYDNMRRYMTIGEMYFICQTKVNVSVFLRAGWGFMGHQATQI